MEKDVNDLLAENEKLSRERDELYIKLNEAREVIEAIGKGSVDAVFVANSETTEVLVSTTADQTYRKFIDNMSEGVVTLDARGVILFSNSSFANIVNLPPEKVNGTNWRKFIPVEYIEEFERFFKEYPANISKVAVSILNNKGEHAHFIVSLNKLELTNVVFNLVWTDVTDQKNIEEKLMIVNENLEIAIKERTLSENKVVALNNKLKENIEILEHANIELATFANVASHDLQEPLRKIITYGSILIRDYYDKIDQKGQTYIRNMESASLRMQSLINDILEYSQLSKRDFLYKPTSIQSVINEILFDMEFVIQETKASITVEKELPVIEAHAGQMRQLFQNLISNALKFRKADIVPVISITYKIVKGKDIGRTNGNMPDEDFCMFYIKDNGIGFHHDYKAQIFTIFQRLNSRAIYKGTGVGLAICKKIVEQHNGSITAESKLTIGSTFTIVLPVRQGARY